MLQCLFWWATTVKKYPVFTSSTHFQGTLIKTEYILTDLRKKRRRTVRNQHLLSVIVLLPFLLFFTFQLKKNFTLSRIQKNLVSRSLNLHLLLDFFLLLFTLYKKWLLLNLVCLQSRPLLPHVGWFSPGLLFYLHLLVCFFFLRFFKLFFFVFSHFVDVVSVNCYVNVCVFVSVTLAINIRSVAFVFRYRISSLFCFVKVYSLFSRVLVGFPLWFDEFWKERNYAIEFRLNKHFFCSWQNWQKIAFLSSVVPKFDRNI